MTNRLLVLIVDDDDDSREIVAESLADEGHRVATAANGREALRMLESDHPRPDLILLDVMMPEMDGWAFRLEQLKDPDLASIPVVLFTAYGTSRDIAVELHAAAVLNKPIRLEELLATVERIAVTR